MERMSVVAEILRWLAVAALGIFAGAMLTEGGVLVPFWRVARAGRVPALVRGERRAPARVLQPRHDVSALVALSAALRRSGKGTPDGGGRSSPPASCS